ncbi:Peptidoglycan-associated lipoprotein [Candidatus Westeberhardia cardiocondylae]|uniref:Peptidoglycan-associated lipoprotein n=1 Tax=Candidatus Westeberhardia cardiocondylae TaxID=1594731 RepID=A0A0H5C5F6_9ENTR|nr:OmpA family protein [Candidatus Westeberhardia cardiocondylae]MCR3756481.1 peptidoglycan-associated outer membrane lipoprotein Pal [Candidatus Westeberhardia cardiocondylae]CEN32186.1 Peptidoglycan-associated lipoprotein [Candidatus Westeberhardia cardiocondylae]
MKFIEFLKKMVFIVSFALITSCDNHNKDINFDIDEKDISAQDIKNELNIINENEINQDNSNENFHLTLRKLQYNNTIYFDLNKYEIRPEFFHILDEYANFLSNNPSYVVIIEGHTDIRGTEEYNIALGKKRSNSVKKYLQNKGISINQIDTISYGKEKLISFGYDEFSHAKNRRAVNILKCLNE